MKLFKKAKKGFTLIELVVVIAVIAILSAVSVVSYVAITNKAKESNDHSMLDQINTSVYAASLTSRKATLHEVLEDLKEDSGFGVDKLKPELKDTEFVYSYEKNMFGYWKTKDSKVVYPEEMVNQKGVDLWFFTDLGADGKLNDGYSHYLKSSQATDITTKGGVDVGKLSIASINLTRSEAADSDIVIRTNGAGTTFTVNAPNDTVHHYDYLDELTITAIDGASYHEHGNVKGKVSISRGHIEIEKGASVPEISVENVSSENSVKVTAKAETLITVDSESAARASVVAESDNVYVTGLPEEKVSGSKKNEVGFPQVITSEAELTNALSSGKSFLQLGADFAVSAKHVFNYDALFDFAGYTLTSSLVNESFIYNNAKMRIIDSGTDGGIVSDNNHVVYNKNTMTIDGGRFSGNRILLNAEKNDHDRGVIYNAERATMTINDAYVFVKTDFAVLNEGYLTVNGGNYVSEAEAKNSLAYGYCVSSYGGKMTINGGSITGVHGCIGINAGEAEINDVHAETVKGGGNSYRALYIAGERDRVSVNINGGYFKSYRMEAASIGNNSDGGLGRLATAVISGGTFINGSSSATPAIKIINSDWTTSSNYGLGEATIYGGKFSSDVSGANGVVSCVQGTDGLWVVNA
jgi:prepilin-type N-terminal cleavage/methylation domain-containing protein